MPFGDTELRFRVLTSLAQWEAFAPQYRAFYESSDASPYLSYEWLHAFISNQPSCDDIRVCIGEDAEGVVAAVPLAAKTGLLSTRLELLGQGPATQDAMPVLERARHLNVLRKACSWLRKHHGKWDHCVLERVPATERARLTAETTAGEGSMLWKRVESSQAIELPGSWDEYLASLSKRHRRNIRRARRRFEAQHRVHMVRAGLDPSEDPRIVERLIEDALSVSRRSWQGSAKYGVAICDTESIGFFRQASRSLSRAGMLDLAVLYADDSPVAFSWGVSREGLGWNSAVGFDAELRALGPGMVLDSLMIQDSIQRGMIRLDWGNEFVEYKKRWCNQAIPLYSVDMYARPVISRLKSRLQERLSHVVKPRLERAA